MRSIQVAICDDEEFFRDELETFISVFGNEYHTDVITETYSNPENLIKVLSDKTKKYDILFLDVEMPQMNGMELAQTIRKIDSDVVICFVTSFLEYALAAYKVDAIDYVVKPIQYSDVKHTMEKAKIQIYYKWDVTEAEKRYIQIKTAREESTIEIDKIIYIEKRRNQSVFHMIDEEYVCYDTLGNIYEKLDRTKFVYTHQGYIANFQQVKEVKKSSVCFSATLEIPLSRKNYPILHEMQLDKIRLLKKEL